GLWAAHFEAASGLAPMPARRRIRLVSLSTRSAYVPMSGGDSTASHRDPLPPGVFSEPAGGLRPDAERLFPDPPSDLRRQALRRRVQAHRRNALAQAER